MSDILTEATPVCSLSETTVQQAKFPLTSIILCAVSFHADVIYVRWGNNMDKVILLLLVLENQNFAGLTRARMVDTIAMVLWGY